MRKIKFFTVMVIIVGLGLCSFLYAEDYPASFGAGSKLIQAGIGVGVARSWGKMGFPPLSISVDYAKPIEGFPISFGGVLGFATSKYGMSYWEWRYTYFMLGARAAYHLDIQNDKIDPYGGVLLGFNIVSVKSPSAYSGVYRAGSSYFLAGAYIGGRYFFKPNLAAYAELGYSFGYLNLGIAYKLP